MTIQMIMNTDNPLIQTLSMAPSVSVLMGLTVPNVELCREMSCWYPLRGTNMVAGNQPKHLLPSFVTKVV